MSFGIIMYNQNMVKKQSWVIQIPKVSRELKLVIMNYELNRALPTGKNKKVIVLMKDGLGGKFVKKFFG